MDRLDYEKKCLTMVEESLLSVKPKRMGMKILSDKEIDKLWNDLPNGAKCGDCRHAITRHQFDSDRKEVISELQGILDDNVSDQDKLNQVKNFVERLNND